MHKYLLNFNDLQIIKIDNDWNDRNIVKEDPTKKKSNIPFYRNKMWRDWELKMM